MAMATWVTEVGFERPGYSSLTGPDTAVSQARIQQSQRPRIQQSQRPRIQQSHRPGYSSLTGPDPDTTVSKARIQQSQRPGYSSLKGPDTAVSKAPDTAVSKAAHPQFESLVEAGDPLAAAKDAGHIRSR